MASLGRCSEALEIISLTLKLAFNSLSMERKEELQLLGARKFLLQVVNTCYIYFVCFPQWARLMTCFIRRWSTKINFLFLRFGVGGYLVPEVSKLTFLATEVCKIVLNSP